MRLSRCGKCSKLIAGIALDGYRPPVSDSVPSRVKALIRECRVANTAERPTFGKILRRLGQVQSRVTAGMKSEKVAASAQKMEEWEEEELRTPPEQ
jgi:hypothetical protein